MFTRCEPNTGRAISWTTALLAAMAGVETRLHWATFSAHANPEIVIIWLVVALFGASLVSAWALRLWRGHRRLQTRYWEEGEGDAAATIVARPLGPEKP